MQLTDLIAALIRKDDLATMRVGLWSVDEQLRRAVAGSAEMLDIDAVASSGPACELIIAGVCREPVQVLPVLARRLTRDGLLIVRLGARHCPAAVQALADAGLDWVAVLTAGEESFVVAASEIRPAELGSLVTDHLVQHPSPSVPQLSQAWADRVRRREVRRYGRDRLMALAARLDERHGQDVWRVVAGIEILAGERGGKATPGTQPAMFLMPDIEISPWPEPSRWQGLQEFDAILERYRPRLLDELQRLVASRSMKAYLDDDYNKSKFQLDTADEWKAIRLINWRDSVPDLPSDCTATRAWLAEISARVSGDVSILRIEPGTTLPWHSDDLDYEQYVHIGLNVPPNCGISVAGEERTWEEGKPIVFSPTFPHTAWNHSDRPRDVIAIDMWHADLSQTEIAALASLRDELELVRLDRQARRRQA